MNALEEGIARFPTLAAAALAGAVTRPAPGPSPAGVLLAGMGGSGIAARALAPFLRRPAVVWADEELPRFHLKGWLVVATSFSGMTRETVAVARAARAAGAHVIGVGTGGELAKVAHQHVAIPVVEGAPPRGSLAGLLGATAGVLETCGALEPGLLARALDALAPSLDDPRAVALAHGLEGPVLAVAHQPHAASAERFAAQLNENAKLVALPAVLPEAGHNLIVPLGTLAAPGPVVTLEAGTALAAKRFEFLAQLLKEQGTAHRRVNSRLDGLAATLDLILVGDAASLRVATERGVDPFAIPMIDRFKRFIGER